MASLKWDLPLYLIEATRTSRLPPSPSTTTHSSTSTSVRRRVGAIIELMGVWCAMELELTLNILTPLVIVVSLIGF